MKNINSGVEFSFFLLQISEFGFIKKILCITQQMGTMRKSLWIVKSTKTVTKDKIRTFLWSLVVRSKVQNEFLNWANRKGKRVFNNYLIHEIKNVKMMYFKKVNWQNLKIAKLVVVVDSIPKRAIFTRILSNLVKVF